MNNPLALETVSLSIGTLLGEHDGAPLPGTLRENEISRDGLKRVLETGVSVRSGPVWGTFGGGPSTGNFYLI